MAAETRTETDLGLILAWQHQHDQRAASELWRRYHNEFLLIARRNLRGLPLHEAPDLVQEAFFIALQRFDPAKVRQNERAFPILVARIMRNCSHQCRRRKLNVVSSENVVVDELLAADATPLQQLEAQQELQQLFLFLQNKGQIEHMDDVAAFIEARCYDETPNWQHLAQQKKRILIAEIGFVTHTVSTRQPPQQLLNALTRFLNNHTDTDLWVESCHLDLEAPLWAERRSRWLTSSLHSSLNSAYRRCEKTGHWQPRLRASYCAQSHFSGLRLWVPNHHVESPDALRMRVKMLLRRYRRNYYGAD